MSGVCRLIFVDRGDLLLFRSLFLSVIMLLSALTVKKGNIHLIRNTISVPYRTVNADMKL